MAEAANTPEPIKSKPASGGSGARQAAPVALGASIALFAFGAAASNSVAVRALLILALLDLAAWAGRAFARRRSGDDPERRPIAMAAAGLVQAGLVLASALYLGWLSVSRVFLPEPVMAGEWGVITVIAAMAVTSLMIGLDRRSARRRSRLDRLAAQAAPAAAALIGVASATWLAAPGLDASAGMVLAVWAGWGGAALLTQSLRSLLERTVNGG